MESFKPNRLTPIYTEHQTKTLYVIYPLFAVSTLLFLQTLCLQASRYLLHEFLFIITFVFLFFFFNILCL